MSEIDPNQTLLRELEPTAAALLDRHLETSKEWFPHQLVPYGRGHDFGPDYVWSPDTLPVPQAVRDALALNLWTEDNLPYYTSTTEGMFGTNDAWGVWNQRWTAEEGRHSIVIRDYLTVSDGYDPIALERGRMQQVSTGKVPKPGTAADGFVYVALQELATRISHFNTGSMLKKVDPVGYLVMKRVAADENFHYLFYRDVASAAIELDPSTMVQAMERQVRWFEMPGTGVDGYSVMAKSIAEAGIYDMQIHYEQILLPVLFKHWHLDELEGLTPSAEQSRDRIMIYLGRMAKKIARDAERKAEQPGAIEQSVTS